MRSPRINIFVCNAKEGLMKPRSFGSRSFRVQGVDFHSVATLPPKTFVAF